MSLAMRSKPASKLRYAAPCRLTSQLPLHDLASRHPAKYTDLKARTLATRVLPLSPNLRLLTPTQMLRYILDELFALCTLVLGA